MAYCCIERRDKSGASAVGCALTVVDQDVSAATGPLVCILGSPPDVIGAREVDGDEVQVVGRELLLHEDRKELVEFRAAPR